MAATTYKDRISETSTSTGSGAVALLGAINGFASFTRFAANQSGIPVLIEAIDVTTVPTGEWEVSLCTLSADRRSLTRNTVRDSSNNGNSVSFNAGLKRVTVVDDGVSVEGRAILAGGNAFVGDQTVVGNVIVTDEAYGPAWDGKGQVPTKNAVFDKIEAVAASIPAAPSSVISDQPYGAPWDGVATIAPSKNAVFDQFIAVQTALGNKADAAALGNYVPKIGGAMTGDLTNTGHFVSTAADYAGFQHTRLGQVGYSLYNQGAIAEWLMYQPDHVGGDDFRVATKVGPTITDMFRIGTNGTVYSKAITASGPLTVGGTVNLIADPGQNGGYWISNEASVPQGILYWNRPSDEIILQRFNPAGTVAEGSIRLGASGIGVAGDITADKGDGRGFLWLGNTGRYLSWDAGAFNFNGPVNASSVVITGGLNASGDVGSTGKFVSANAAQPYGFTHSVAGAAGYHLYNQGAATEWLMYQPAHATGDDFRIAARGNNVNTDALKIAPNLAVTITSSLTLGDHLYMTGANATVYCREVRIDNGSNGGAIWLGPPAGQHYLYWDGGKYILGNGPLTVGGTVTAIGSIAIAGATAGAATQLLFDGGNSGRITALPTYWELRAATYSICNMAGAALLTIAASGDANVAGNITAVGSTINVNNGRAIFSHDTVNGYLRTQGGWGDMWLGANGNNYVAIAGADGAVRCGHHLGAAHEIWCGRAGSGQGVLRFGGENTSLNYIWHDGSKFIFSTNATSVNLDGQLYPTPDNSRICGGPSNRWAQLYCVTTTINTSDEREKEQIAPLTDAVLDAWAEVEWVSYKWKHAVAEKGEGARLHIGLVAQRVAAVFEAHGLDGFALGLLCYDTWGESVSKTLAPAPPAPKQKGRQGKGVEEKTPDAVVIETVVPAGDRYGVRYEEALALEAALARRDRARLEARIAAFEKAA
jgi:hypothetical protein